MHLAVEVCIHCQEAMFTYLITGLNADETGIPEGGVGPGELLKQAAMLILGLREKYKLTQVAIHAISLELLVLYRSELMC